MTAPDVDDGLAVDIDGDGRAHLLAVGDRLREGFGDLVESGVPVAVHDFVHRHIMR